VELSFVTAVPCGTCPQDAGVTVVQSIVASVASRWATQETNAPWFRNPAGVAICAAADTSAP
jgi:hypothetical protein